MIEEENIYVKDREIKNYIVLELQTFRKNSKEAQKAQLTLGKIAWRARKDGMTLIDKRTGRVLSIEESFPYLLDLVKYLGNEDVELEESRGRGAR